jgi:hypothetical protein
MGLFQKIAKAMRPGGGADDSELLRPLETLNRNNRLHPRYLLPEGGLATLRLADGTVGPLVDLSYGGVAAVYPRAITVDPARMPASLTATLVLLDRSIPCQLLPSRMVPQSGGERVLVGFRLRHDTPDVLLFLREFIEPMRCGMTLAALAPDFRREKYRGSEWSCLRGDGPFDAIIKSDPATGKVQEALLTFKISDHYCELSFAGGVLRTGHSVTGGEANLMAMGSQMNQSAAADKAVLRHAIAALLGAPPTVQPRLTSLLGELLGSLTIDEKKGAA